MKITKKEQYAIASIADLLTGKTPRDGWIILDDCGVQAQDAQVILALAARLSATFAADATPFPEHEN